VNTTLTGVLQESRQRGFLGPGPVEDHVRHALGFVEGVGEAPSAAVDLGSGGGVPALVLATTHWHQCSWVLLDSQLRRIEFLNWAVQELGLDDRVEVCGERAEDFARSPERRGRYDLVTARSFGPPGVTAECAAPLLCPGGTLVVSEPPTGSLIDRWPNAGLAELGLGPARETVSTDRQTHLASMTLVSEVSDRYPRRVGIPSKRPLF